MKKSGFLTAAALLALVLSLAGCGVITDSASRPPEETSSDPFNASTPAFTAPTTGSAMLIVTADVPLAAFTTVPSDMASTAGSTVSAVSMPTAPVTVTSWSAGNTTPRPVVIQPAATTQRPAATTQLPVTTARQLTTTAAPPVKAETSFQISDSAGAVLFTARDLSAVTAEKPEGQTGYCLQFLANETGAAKLQSLSAQYRGQDLSLYVGGSFSSKINFPSAVTNGIFRAFSFANKADAEALVRQIMRDVPAVSATQSAVPSTTAATQSGGGSSQSTTAPTSPSASSFAMTDAYNNIFMTAADLKDVAVSFNAGTNAWRITFNFKDAAKLTRESTRLDGQTVRLFIGKTRISEFPMQIITSGRFHLDGYTEPEANTLAGVARKDIV